MPPATVVSADVDVDVATVPPAVAAPPLPVLLAPRDVEPAPALVVAPVLPLSEVAPVALVVALELSAAGSDSEEHAASKRYATTPEKLANQRCEAPQHK